MAGSFYPFCIAVDEFGASEAKELGDLDTNVDANPNGVDNTIDNMDGSNEDMILAAFHILHRRGRRMQLSADAAKKALRSSGNRHDSGNGKFLFGQSCGGVTGKDLRALLRRLLAGGPKRFPAPDGNRRLFVPSLASRVVNSLNIKAEHEVRHCLLLFLAQGALTFGLHWRRPA